jgi:anti-sigma regulatory factor (Ser/Thr protein kinase)
LESVGGTDGFVPSPFVCFGGVLQRTRGAVCRHVAAKLPPEPASVAAARRLVDRQLRAWEVDLADGTISLLVSELVTNAVVHAGTEIELVVAIAGGTVEVGVTDGVSGSVTPSHLAWTSEGGRGLLLVERLAREWGTQSVPAGKCVWFRIGLDGWAWQQQCSCHGEDLHDTVLLPSGSRLRILEPH